MARRRIPRWSELRPYLRTGPVRLSSVERRLASAATIWDLRSVARRHVPRAVFDYVDGAAETETSLRRSREAFARVEFVPRVLRDVSDVDLSTTILGREVAMPLVFAPTGFTRLMHQEGEPSVARVASRMGIPYALSTLGTSSPEDVAAAAPDADLWFQLYLWNDRTAALDLVRRARESGFRVLVVTVDVPVAGARLRDKRNGMSIPPALTLRTIANALPRPQWWIDFLTTEPLAFASLDRWSGTVAELLDSMFDPTVTFDDLAWIKSQWPGKVVVKGIQTLADARAVTNLGVDGIVLSNHGGRQLDRAPIPFHLLPSVAADVGKDVEILLDTGIMSGADIVASIALGARFTLVGRAYLYGLMAGGEAGVDRTIEILSEQVARTMRLLGVAALEELNPGHVTQLIRLAPRPLLGHPPGS